MNLLSPQICILRMFFCWVCWKERERETVSGWTSRQERTRRKKEGGGRNEGGRGRKKGRRKEESKGTRKRRRKEGRQERKRGRKEEKKWLGRGEETRTCRAHSNFPSQPAPWRRREDRPPPPMSANGHGWPDVLLCGARGGLRVYLV